VTCPPDLVQINFRIFTRKHYSVMWVPGNQPRSLFKGENPTDEEKCFPDEWSTTIGSASRKA